MTEHRHETYLRNARAQSSGGTGSSTNPANSQDVSRRSNPQDMTLPRAVNPQDSRGTGTPQIYKPER